MRTIKNSGFCVKPGQNLFFSACFLALGTGLSGRLQAASPNRYDVVVADSQATIYAFSPQTGQRVIISQADKLDRPYDVARNHDGNLVVSDTGTLRIVLINPSTGQQTVLAEGA